MGFSFFASSIFFPPSCFPRVPLAVPYWNRETYRCFYDCIASGRVVRGFELGKLESAIVETLGVTGVLLAGSGSLAIELALRAFGVGRGDEVIIPAFCCTAIAPPILAAGAAPVFADVGDDLNITPETVDAVLSRKTKAVIVPHLFGNPADIRGIVALAHGKEIYVIDDAAQALGATIDGRPVGGFGDAGIVSFGWGKVCAGLGGGALVCRNEELLSRIENTELSQPSYAYMLRNCLSSITWHRWRRWTSPLQRALIHFRGYDPVTPPRPYRREAMANLSAAVAVSLVRTLQKNIAARHALVAGYRQFLAGSEDFELVPHGTGSACLNQVVRVLPRGGADDLTVRILQRLRKTGYEVQGSYIPIHLIPEYEGCRRGRLTQTERIWEDLIELPCEPSVDLQDAMRIAEIIKTLPRD